MLTINTDPKIESLLRDATWKVTFYKGKLVTQKIRADFTQDSFDLKEVERYKSELAIAENTLSVLIEKLGLKEENTNAIKQLYS